MSTNNTIGINRDAAEEMKGRWVIRRQWEILMEKRREEHRRDRGWWKIVRLLFGD